MAATAQADRLAPGLQSSDPVRRASGLLLASSFLIGLAQISVLPPWEGFDETAHYSYIAQIAELGTWPRFHDPLYEPVEDYRRIAPTPYASVEPFDVNHGQTYQSFFAAAPATIAAGRSAINVPRADSPGWRAGTEENWEAQHPPAFYALLAPLFSASATWSLADQLFLLRTIAFVFAWASLWVTVASSATVAQALGGGQELGRCIALGALFWPYLFPGWFPMMARLGNDGLVAFDAALVWVAFARSFDRPSLRNGLVLGALCGVGLLIKATMLPLILCMFAFLSLAAWRTRHAPAGRRHVVRAAVVAVTTAGIAGWWYVGKFFETGNLVGSKDLAASTGGLASVLVNPHALWLFAKGWVFVASSFFWSSTWSFVSLPSVLLLPLVIGAMGFAEGHARWLHQRNGVIRWFPATALVLFCAGLAVHLVYFIASTGGGGTPGWYLQSLAPVLAVIVGTAFVVRRRERWFLRTTSAVLTYGVFYIVASTYLETLVFSGCGKKGHLLNRYEYDLASGCMTDGARIVDHLAVLGSPGAALCFGLLGLVLLALGLRTAARCAFDFERSNPTVRPASRLPMPRAGSGKRQAFPSADGQANE